MIASGAPDPSDRCDWKLVSAWCQACGHEQSFAPQKRLTAERPPAAPRGRRVVGYACEECGVYGLLEALPDGWRYCGTMRHRGAYDVAPRGALGALSARGAR